METLYRKYRPKDFDSVVGQDAIIRTIKNQIASGTIAHAYLFSGTRGTGKTTVAKIFARAVNCPNQKDGNPCNQCDVCKAGLSNSDYNIIELDAASNGNVEKVRQITDSMQYPPINDEKYKVYIIDEAHALSGFSKEAFLKSLEEPPEYVIYILATTEPNKLPETILSRCQKYNFRRINIDTIVSYLKKICEAESIIITDDALHFIAEKSDGSMRESLSLLDRCRSYTKEELDKNKVLDILGIVDDDEYFDILYNINIGNINASLELFNKNIEKGKDIIQFANGIIWHARNLLLAKNLDSPVESLNITKINFDKLKQESNSFSKDVLIYYIEELSKTVNVMRYDDNRRVILETAFIRLSNPETCFIESAVMARIKKMEESIKSGTYVNITNDKINNLKNDIKDEKKLSDSVGEKNDVISEIKLSKINYDEMNLIKDNWQAIKAPLDLTSKSILSSVEILPGSENEPGYVNLLIDEIDYNMLSGLGKIEQIEKELYESSKKIINKEVIYKFLNRKNTNYAQKVVWKLEDAYAKINGIEIEVEDD